MLCMSSVSVALASLIMMTLKFSIAASRAVDSQQPLDAVPAINSVSIPRALQKGFDIGAALYEGAETLLDDVEILRLRIQRRPQLESFGSFIHGCPAVRR